MMRGEGGGWRISILIGFICIKPIIFNWLNTEYLIQEFKMKTFGTNVMGHFTQKTLDISATIKPRHFNQFQFDTFVLCRIIAAMINWLKLLQSFFFVFFSAELSQFQFG